MIKEMDKIKETLQYFSDGLNSLDTDLISKAFHPSSFLMESTPQGLISVSRNNWLEHLNSIKTDKNHPFVKQSIKMNIISIDITGQAASAKVEWESGNIKFTDYYNLLKIEESWLIMNKIWFTEVRDSI